MKSEKNLQLTLPEGTVKEGNLTITHVQAPLPPAPLPLHEEKPYKLSGIISTPGDFAEKRSTEFNALSAHVIANFTQRSIVLVIDEKNHFSCSVAGKLELDPELESLHINTETLYDENELIDKLNFFRRHFEKVSQHSSLMDALKKFNAKVETEIVNANNLKGNAVLKKAYDIKHEIPLDFVLNMPIFAGGEKFSLGVEINLKYVDGEIVFWFQSIGLHDAIGEQTEKVLEKELQRLAAYAIIRQY